MSWLLGAVIAVAVAALLLLFVTLVLLAPVWRKRRALAPAALWRASALPGPQTVNNYFLSATPEQMAQVVARQIDEGR